jgi:hypothetical protein
MMKTSVLAFCIVILAFFLGSPFIVNAAPVGKVRRVEGRVDVLKQGRTVVSTVSPHERYFSLNTVASLSSHSITWHTEPSSREATS